MATEIFYSTVYDIIIVGAGPAGLTAARFLSAAGKQVLVLEKRDSSLSGKVCGDGLSSHCIKVMERLGISEEDLQSLGGVKVLRNITSEHGKLRQRFYKENDEFASFSYGVSRDRLDNFLCQLAVNEGAEIRFGRNVKTVVKEKDRYIIDNHLTAKKVIYACGAASGLPTVAANKLSLLPAGISARVIGDCKLPNDAFYFKYDFHYGNGYAWIFPVGDHIWNYGIWTVDRKKDLNVLFHELEEHLKNTYFSELVYERKPKGALVGADLRGNRILPSDDLICIGDSALHADVRSGEGISFAMEGGWRIARSIIDNEPAKKIYVPQSQWSFNHGIMEITEPKLLGESIG